MRLDQEVRHNSEDIEGDGLLDVVKALHRGIRIVNRAYDIPYIAGYSIDGHTIFIDSWGLNVACVFDPSGVLWHTSRRHLNTAARSSPSSVKRVRPRPLVLRMAVSPRV